MSSFMIMIIGRVGRLTACGLVTHLMVRKWFTWWHQAITRTIVDSLSKKLRNIYLRTIPLDIFNISITKSHLQIEHSKSRQYLREQWVNHGLFFLHKVQVRKCRKRWRFIAYTAQGYYLNWLRILMIRPYMNIFKGNYIAIRLFTFQNTIFRLISLPSLFFGTWKPHCKQLNHTSHHGCNKQAVYHAISYFFRGFHT